MLHKPCLSLWLGGLLCTPLLVLSACGGGGTTNPPASPPVITAVAPTGLTAPSGATTTFQATASGNPTAWAWNFGDGAFPGTSSEASPEVSLTTVGTHTGTITATNAAGSSDPFSFLFEVTPGVAAPRIFVVVPEGVVGALNEQVTFGLIASGSPTTYEWDFGPGAVPRTSSEKDPVVTLANAGENIGRATVSNNAGPSQEAVFKYRVSQAPTWTSVAVDPGHGMPGAVDFLIHQDRLTAAYVTGDPQDLRIVQAEIAAPIAASDWSAYTLDTRLEGEIDLEVIADRLAVLYARRASASLRPRLLAQAFVVHPASGADWQKFTLAEEGFLHRQTLVEFEGAPALVYGLPGERLRLARATAPFPQTLTDWELSWATPEGTRVHSQEFSFILQGDRLALAFRASNDSMNQVIWSRATLPHPAVDTDWSTHIVDSANDGNFGEALGLGLVAGRPFLTFLTSAPTVAVHARVAEPASTADWRFTILDTRAFTLDTNFVDGLPTVIYRQILAPFNRPTRFQRAWNDSPQLLTDWSESTHLSGPLYTSAQSSPIVLARLQGILYGAVVIGTTGFAIAQSPDPW